jgi:hypothetical protein
MDRLFNGWHFPLGYLPVPIQTEVMHGVDKIYQGSVVYCHNDFIHILQFIFCLPRSKGSQ